MLISNLNWKQANKVIDFIQEVFPETSVSEPMFTDEGTYELEVVSAHPYCIEE